MAYLGVFIAGFVFQAVLELFLDLLRPPEPIAPAPMTRAEIEELIEHSRSSLEQSLRRNFEAVQASYAKRNG